MKNKFQKWVSRQPSMFICNLPKIFLAFIMIPIVWCIYQLFQVQKDSTIILLLLFIIIIECFWIFSYKLVLNSVQLILTENIDLQKYSQCLLRILSHHFLGKKKLQLQSDFVKAQVAFLRGNFEESLQLLTQLKNNEVFSSSSETLKENQLYYEFLNYCKLSQFENAEILLDKLPEEYKESSKFILKVLRGDVSDYVFESEPRTRLVKIGRYYYQALNFLNANNKSAAKAKFQQIASENPELFYVREAKKYLEELKND